MPWFLILLGGFAAGTTLLRKRPLAAIAVVIAGCVLSALFWPGRFYAEKMLTDLALPLGAVWSLLLAAAVWSLTRRWRGTAITFLLFAGLLSVGGNGDVADLVVRPLEAPYRGIDPFAEDPFDAVVVLGGGLSTGPDRRIMTNASGDRVVLGARLYHTGVARSLVCTGKTPQLDPTLPSAAETTAILWQQLGVPPKAITQVGGENTRAETGELKRLAAERGWTRLGLVTSAWHMGRAERLAKAAGLAVTPLPADFQSEPDLTIDPWLRVRTFSVIPSPTAFGRMHIAIKEYLAWAVGR